MTIHELAENWIQNDRTGTPSRITIEQATQMVGWMDPDTIEQLDDEITPESWMEAWNSIVE